MAAALSMLRTFRFRDILLLTRNKPAVLTIKKPRQQSGQEQGRRFYEITRRLRLEGNMPRVAWLPSCKGDNLLKLAKEKAKAATRQGGTPQMQLPNMWSTTPRVARAERRTTRSLSGNVGKHSKSGDTGLPGRHNISARETVDHFLFRCTKWAAYRSELLRCTVVHRSNMSFYLGGKSPSDNNSWSPNMEAVRATIHFAIATGRLDASQPQEDTS
jgi:hypothetical protein